GSYSAPPTEFRWTSAADRHEDPHYYELHVHIQNFSGGLDTSFTTGDTSFSSLTVPFFKNAGSYTWYVMIRDEFTEVSSQDTFHFVFGPDAVGDDLNSPRIFSLGQNYPNPFNPLTKIEFELGTISEVTLRIYDLVGKEVKTLLNHQQL